MSLIPVTILTGFLGSGKTTLLKRLLTEAHGQKIAVIENEFGEENIDNDILVADTEEHIVQMSNGCVCCTIREDLRETLSDLVRQKKAGTLNFERVVIETTGVADPGPVAQTFFMDDEIAESYLLDAIVTLVDAKHGDQQLDPRPEATPGEEDDPTGSARIVAMLVVGSPQAIPRAAFHAVVDQARHWSRPAWNRSFGRSMPMNTILLIFCSPAAHLGPVSLPMSWCTPWNTTLRSIPVTYSTPL